jgi:hypothetical protein
MSWARKSSLARPRSEARKFEAVLGTRSVLCLSTVFPMRVGVGRRRSRQKYSPAQRAIAGVIGPLPPTPSNHPERRPPAPPPPAIPSAGAHGPGSRSGLGALRAGPVPYHADRVPGIPDRRRPSARRPASPLRALRTRQSPAMDEGLALPHRLRLDSGQRQTASARACPNPRTASTSPGPGAFAHIMPGRACLNPIACDRRSRLSSAFPPPPCVPNAT